jgi:virginiamycin B lyase
MRAALAVCLVLLAACSGPITQPSATATPLSKLASGGVVEYPLPNPSTPGSACSGCGTASLSGITAGPDGNVWFFDVGQNLLGRVTPAGSITQFAVPATGAGSEGIVGAPDGNVWMVARGSMNGPDWILKVSPAGVVTRYPLANGVGAEGITWGPDGNVWFTEFWVQKVVRMTPAGVMTEFPIPNPNPRGIVTGPDHNLWFVDGNLQHESIARMTTTGVVTEYALGSNMTQQLQPYNIVSGPDGNLWFSEIGHIGRITPEGVITHFPLSGQNSSATGVAGGADGNVWFTNPGANTVGRITPTGAIRQYPLPARNAQPAGIAHGSDGRLWFTEAGVSRIASIGTTVPEAKLSSRVLTFAAGSATTREVTVTNTGDADLVIAGSALVGPDQAAFRLAHDDCTGHRLAVQSSCHIGVALTSGLQPGIRAARLAITDNATASPQSISLVAQLPDCKLPVFTSTDSIAQGGFLSLRDGVVTVDPKGGFVPGGLLSHSQASPVLYGQLPATYDLVADRWVPGGRVSPDGTRYAWVEFSSQGSDFHVHVTDVATGRDRVLNLPTGNWGLLAFTTAGLYVNTTYPEVGAAPGLWLVNPDSGARQTIFSDSAVQSMSGQVAWIADRNNADTLAGPPGMGVANNEIKGRDVNTGVTTTWMYRPGSDLYVGAAANGTIVVSGRDLTSSYLWVLTSPGQPQPVTVPGTNDAVPSTSGVVADANGWWLGSLDGIYLWTPRAGAVLVSESLAAPAGVCA